VLISQCKASAAANSMLSVSHSRWSIVSVGSCQLDPRVNSMINMLLPSSICASLLVVLGTDDPRQAGNCDNFGRKSETVSTEEIACFKSSISTSVGGNVRALNAMSNTGRSRLGKLTARPDRGAQRRVQSCPSVGKPRRRLPAGADKPVYNRSAMLRSYRRSF
jgi:hypothetical protein